MKQFIITTWRTYEERELVQAESLEACTEGDWEYVMNDEGNAFVEDPRCFTADEQDIEEVEE